MSKYLIGYAAAFFTMVLIDLLWLGVIAKPLYQRGIGHLMADSPNMTAAALFYIMYPIGLIIFAVLPNAAKGNWVAVATSAALFGFFVYATYDLTNLATLKNWPVSLSVIDVAWGTFVSAVAAVAARAAMDRW